MRAMGDSQESTISFRASEQMRALLEAVAKKKRKPDVSTLLRDEIRRLISDTFSKGEQKTYLEMLGLKFTNGESDIAPPSESSNGQRPRKRAA